MKTAVEKGLAFHSSNTYKPLLLAMDLSIKNNKYLHTHLDNVQKQFLDDMLLLHTMSTLQGVALQYHKC